MGLFDFLRKTTKNKVLFLGLDSSGKSTIISFLQTGHFVEHTPTMGKARTDIEVQGLKISLFDMGGQTNFRKMWLGELNGAKLVIYVLDSTDTARFSEAKKELDALLPTIKANNISVLFQ